MRDEDAFRRIAALESKVTDLYRKLGEREPDLSNRAVDDPDPRLIELIQRGKQIEAIKLYRELTGKGLADAQRDVRELGRTYGRTS